MHVLYCHRESGHSYKVALALTLMGIAFEQRPVDLNLPRSERSDDFRNASLFGEVPVLVLPDGMAISQSNVILHALARWNRLFDGRTTAERVRVREWLAWEANRLAMSLPHLRYSRMFAPAGDALEKWWTQRMIVDLDRLNAELRNKRFVVGDEPTVADISLCGYLFWADQARVDLGEWPDVVAWLARIRALDGWRAPYDLLQPAAPLLAGTRP
jgi:glutathione S-transferase